MTEEVKSVLDNIDQVKQEYNISTKCNTLLNELIELLGKKKKIDDEVDRKIKYIATNFDINL